MFRLSGKEATTSQAESRSRRAARRLLVAAGTAGERAALGKKILDTAGYAEMRVLLTVGGRREKAATEKNPKSQFPQ